MHSRMGWHSLYLTRNKTKTPIAHVFWCQVARVCSSISSPGEVQSNVTCKCHLRNGARYLQHFSSLGPKPRLFYEILDFLTIRNILFFYILSRPQGPHGLISGHLWLTGGCFFSHLFIFSISGDLASSVSPSRSSPWCLASKRAQPALEQVYMASESWTLCQPQSPITIRGEGFTLEWIPHAPSSHHMEQGSHEGS